MQRALGRDRQERQDGECPACHRPKTVANAEGEEVMRVPP